MSQRTTIPSRVDGGDGHLCIVTWPGFDPADLSSAGRLEAAGIMTKFVPNSTARSAADVAELVQAASAAIVSTDPFDETVFSSAPRLRVIARTGVGTDSIDLSAATAAGIVVTTVNANYEEVVADHTLALVLGAVRRVIENNGSLRRGEWSRAGALTPWELNRRTVGLIGLGKIGWAVARRLKGFECKLLAYDPAAIDMQDIERVTLNELLQRADIVSIHVPLNADTRALIGARELAHMPPHAILVNTARGGIVDEPSLVAALRDGRLRAAAMDVFAEEPPNSSELLSLDNVLVSPHIASFSPDSIETMNQQAITSVLDVLAGRLAHGIVNPEVLDHPRYRIATRHRSGDEQGRGA